MSWAAHDLEPYVIQRHAGRRIAFVPLLLGSYAPDMASKWFVYGISIFGAELKADNPAQFHRGWPGVGFTHSLAFGVVVALIIYAISRNRIVSGSFLVGHWAHALTDMGDTVGTMLFFPFTDNLFSVGAWAYAGQTGRFTDAGAYFSGFGFVWDGVFLVWALASWRVLTRSYFRSTVAQADPFWRWAGKYLSEGALLAIYRASFFYGSCRWVAWLFWAHVVKAFPFDLTWGGPRWVPAVHASELNAGGCAPCSCPGCGASSPKLAMYATIAVVARLKGAAGSAREALHEAPLVRREPRRRARPGIRGRVLRARRRRDDGVDPPVG
jgi:membrane-bound metal-dependent hydrolase YbcI (DUF457 family)